MSLHIAIKTDVRTEGLASIRDLFNTTPMFEISIYNDIAKRLKSKNFPKDWLICSSDWNASGIEPNAGVEPAALRLRVSRSTD